MLGKECLGERVVQGWVTSWEVLMLHLLFHRSSCAIIMRLMYRIPSTHCRCDQTNTNALDPIRTLRLSVLGKDKVVLGWVTSWEIMVGMHIVINRATLDRCDHMITNAPNPIRTP
ncbi:hypothetical protein CR513_50475, partial [Mucuna pruriens]